MKKKNLLFLPILTIGLFSCGNSEESGPKNTLTITTNKTLFRIGDYLDPTDFEVRTANGEKITDFTITDYNLFSQSAQTIKFTDSSGFNYGTFDLTLQPRRDNLKVLFLANSHADDTLTYAYNLVKTLDVNLPSVHFVNNYKGGHDLQGYGNEGINEIEVYTFNDFNLDNPYSDKETRAMKYAIEADSWDFIVLQQYTQEYFLTAQFGNISRIAEYAKQYCSNPNVKFLFNMTPAYPDGTNLPNFKLKFDGSCDKLYQKEIECINQYILPNEYIDAVIPVGTAIKNAMTSSSLTVNDLWRDDGVPQLWEHLSLNKGRFIAGMAFVSFITGYSADLMSFTNGNDESFMQIARESVKNAMSNPFTETPFNN